MSLAARSADPPRDLPISDVEITHPSKAPELTGRLGGKAPIVWVRGFIDRARSDSLIRNGVFITATQVVSSAFGYVFWLLAAHLYSPTVVGLTAAVTSPTPALRSVLCLGR